MEYFNYGEQDFVPCENPMCNKRSGPPHHIIKRSKFGKKRKDEQDKIENIVGLCFTCHEKAESNILPAYEIKRFHEIFMKINGKTK
jgi:hypothetical protein